MTTWVVLHGASGSAATWESVGLDGAGEVLALDLPGRGAIPGPARSSVPELAAWLVEELDRRGVAEAVVLGHSLGGAVALQAAMDAPEWVAGLVLVSSAARLRVHPSIFEAVEASTPERPFRLDMAFGASASRAVVDAYAAATASVPPETAMADWRACDGFDVRERLSEVSCPTLVVYGDADALTVPRFQGGLAEALGAETAVVEGVGHMLPWEAPGRLVEIVRGWVRRE